MDGCGRWPLWYPIVLSLEYSFKGSKVNIAAQHWYVMKVNDERIEVDVTAYQTHKLLDSFHINY